jgi:hypothetical protein
VVVALELMHQERSVERMEQTLFLAQLLQRAAAAAARSVIHFKTD